MANIRNTSLRFNLDKPIYQKAWDYLQGLDKSEFKSYSHAIAVSVTDYFERYNRNKTDPYFENREREEKFVEQIISAVEKALEKTIPNFLTACLAGVIGRHPIPIVEVMDNRDEINSDLVDLDFIGS